MAQLFRQFILRRLAGDRLRTGTTIAGIALGIAVVIAIQLANAASVRGFARALDAMAGRAALEIVGPGGGIDETHLPALGWLREHGVAAPVVEGEMTAIPAAGRAEAMRVLGADLLRDRAIRDYRVAAGSGGSGLAGRAGDLTATTFLDLLTSPRAVVLTEKFAMRHGLGAGDTLRLAAGDRVESYTVGALLLDEGPARVLDGNFVLMDIAAAQLALGRLGWIDRIDLRLHDGRDPGAALAAIAARLPPGLVVQRPAQRGEQVERMLAAFHTNLAALSWIALIVGLFLVYNSVTISVIARREEIALLRALGVTRRQVTALFLGEAAALGAAGTALGLALARVLADGAVALTAATVDTLYVTAAAVPPALEGRHVGLAAAIGLPLSLLAAAVPAREAARVPPAAAIRGSDVVAFRHRLPPRRLGVALALLGASAWLATRDAVSGVPVFGYLSAFAAICGASLLAPAALAGAARLARRPLRLGRGAAGLLAHANLTAAIPRLAISVAALAAALSMLVAIAVMVGSFRDTVRYWVSQTLQADLFIRPGLRGAPGTEQPVSPELLAAIASDPDVEALDAFHHTEIVFEGRLVVLGAGRLDVVLSHGALLVKSPADGRAALASAIGADAVLVSEAFATRFGRRVGDILELPTPAGPRAFRIAAVYYDYSTDRGAIVMDERTFRQQYGDRAPTGVAAYLRAGADADAARARILGALADGHRVFIHTNRSLRAEVLRIFDATFAVTYALEAIAVFVAVLGVTGTLLALVLERRRDLAILRLVGADRRQLRRMVVIEAALIGAVSQAIGLATGFVLSLLLIYVINVQSFGWTIQFHLPAGFLAQAAAAVIAATALAGLYPARLAAGLGPLREE